jgi:hypothetical protein
MDSTTQEYKNLNNSDPYYIAIFGFSVIITGFALTIIISLLCCKLKTKDKKCKSNNSLYGMLLWVDLMCILSILITWVDNFSQFNAYFEIGTLCNLNSFLTSITITTIVNIAAVISLQQCLEVAFKKYYRSNYYIIIVGALFLISVANGVQINMNNGINIYPIALSCSYSAVKNNNSIGSAIFAISGVISYTVIIICYIVVIIYKRDQSKKVRIEVESSQSKENKEASSKTAKSLLILFVSITTIGLYATMCVYAWFDPEKLSPTTDMIQFVLLESQITIYIFILLDLMPSIWNEALILYMLDINIPK